MVADKGKKSKLNEEDDSDHIDGDLVLSIEKLQEVQDNLEKINEEASDKVLEVEQKYNEIRRPVYLKRNEIIKSIPDFWLTAFLSHPVLADYVSDEDQEIFRYIDSLDVEDSKDVKSGYSIAFNFKENPYFEDTKLTKTFTFTDEGTKITCTNIKWKEGTVTGAANGVNNEKKGNKRPLPDTSFFTWFEEVEQKDISEIQDEVADIIKDDLWPNPLRYFSNEPDEEDSGEGEDEKGNSEEEEEEEEDGKDNNEGGN